MSGFRAHSTWSAARRVLNGLAAGYARPVNRQGAMAEEPADGLYRLLIEALESFVATARVSSDEEPKRYAIGQDGRPYLTASATRAQPFVPQKDRWWEEGPEGPRSALPPGHPIRR
jgi:hypothetical protein